MNDNLKEANARILELDQELVALVTRWAETLSETELTSTFMRHSVMMALHIDTPQVNFIRIIREMWKIYAEAKRNQPKGLQ